MPLRLIDRLIGFSRILLRKAKYNNHQPCWHIIGEGDSKSFYNGSNIWLNNKTEKKNTSCNNTPTRKRGGLINIIEFNHHTAQLYYREMERDESIKWPFPRDHWDLLILLTTYHIYIYGPIFNVCQISFHPEMTPPPQFPIPVEDRFIWGPWKPQWKVSHHNTRGLCRYQV